jgi:hypothetical protein
LEGAIEAVSALRMATIEPLVESTFNRGTRPPDPTTGGVEWRSEDAAGS